jgi:predicted ferric reductase
VVLIVLGYAKLNATGPLHQLMQFITGYPDMLAALVAYGLLVMVGVVSIRIARRRLEYETWWVAHLYAYLAVALALAHQINTGVAFVGHPLSREVWLAAWIAAGVCVLAFRVGLPVIQNLRHQLRVERVVAEAPGVCSVVIKGSGLSRLAVSGGQFFQWRFMTKELWWHAHPYSLSALPRPPFLRITVKGLGEHSSKIAELKPGTRVLVEGPYGVFTHHSRSSELAVLIGAGVGLTPLRALLEELPSSVDVTVIVRASEHGDIVHRAEIAQLVEQHAGTLRELVGSRRDVQLDRHTIRQIAPDIARSDVYVCGPSGFNAEVVDAVRRLGVPGERIHVEEFSF